MYLAHVMYICMYTVLMYRKQQRNVAYSLIYAHMRDRAIRFALSRRSVFALGFQPFLSVLLLVQFCELIGKRSGKGRVDIEPHREIMSRPLRISWTRVHARMIAILA